MFPSCQHTAVYDEDTQNEVSKCVIPIMLSISKGSDSPGLTAMLLLVTMQPVIARNPEAPQLQGDFQWPKLRVNNFAVDQAWRVDRHPRFLADVNDDDRADIVGFGDAGVYVSLATGSGNFNPIEFKTP
jgi:hypothetical protein